MDKYEYKIKAEEIIRLAGKKQYPAAVRIADEIRWERVKNIQMLCTVSEIYEQVGKYDESKDVLLLAYNRSPNGKMIVYRLVELSIALKDYQEATDFYHEYVQMAPNDSNALILKYKLYKGRGAKLQTLIAILEEFKTRDYEEEWILELARLYHQAGDGEKCVENCNEIDLWFNKGPRVLQALELKKIYAPLTPLQEKKLQKRGRYGKETLAEEPVKEEWSEEPEPDMQEERKTILQYEQPVQNLQSPQATKMLAEPETEAAADWPVYGEKEAALSQPQADAVPDISIVPDQPDPVWEAEESGEQLIGKTVGSILGKPAEGTVADAIIKMTKMQADTGIEKGFSILPKGNVVKKDAPEYAFNLPGGVEEMKIPIQKEELSAVRTERAGQLQDAAADSKREQMFENRALQFEPSDLQTEGTEEEAPQFEPSDLQAEEPEEKALEFKPLDRRAKGLNLPASEPAADTEDEPEEKPKGLLGKMLSKFTMEDDELDDDFNDDYEDDDDEDSREERMVTRGLTGQYEKIVMEDEEEDDSDPLNARLAEPAAEEEEEYEYIYGDEDEAEEYEDLDEEDGQPTRENKRFRFFRNTMEDDDLFEEEEPYEEEFYEEEQTGASLQEPTIPLSYAAKYDTLNLQKELAKSIQQLMDATEKETVDSTLENVKKMVERSNIPELTETMRFKAVRGSMLNRVAKKQAEKLEQGKDIESVVSDNSIHIQLPDTLLPAEDATVSMAEARPKPIAEPAIRLKVTEEEQHTPIENILTREDDGQLSLLMPEESPEEEQIAGQLNMEDVLREWEKQKLLSENDKEKRALEEARRRALEETRGIMTEIMGLLKDVIPKIGAIKDGEEKMSVLAKSLEKVQMTLPLTQGVVEAAEDSKEAASAIEAACAEAVIELEKMEGLAEEATKDPVDVMEDEIEKDLPEGTEELAWEPEEEPAEEAGDTQNRYLQEQMALQGVFDGAPQDGETLFAEPEREAESEEVTEDVEAILEAALTDEDGNPYEEEEVSVELVPEFAKNTETALEDEEEEIPYGGLKEEIDDGLSEEQKEILAYFLAIKAIRPTITDIVKRTEYAPEHMIVTGGEGSGRTSIAMRIIKAAQVHKDDKIETIAKIKATLLNQKKVTEIFDKVNGGVLIIEQAGSLKPTTVYAIEEALYSNRYYVQMILVDTRSAIFKLLRSTTSFLNDIQMCIDLPVYNNNELAEFAKTYAQVNGYVFDGMAILALHSVIELFQTDQHAVNLEDVKNIMDEAMERADRRSRKLFGKLFSKKTDDTILLESDFE